MRLLRILLSLSLCFMLLTNTDATAQKAKVFRTAVKTARVGHRAADQQRQNERMKTIMSSKQRKNNAVQTSGSTSRTTNGIQVRRSTNRHAQAFQEECEKYERDRQRRSREVEQTTRNLNNTLRSLGF